MEAEASEINKLWRSSFVWKYSKFKVDFNNQEKISEKVFCFWDNCIGIGCVNFSLLGREYLPTALNVLRNSLKILLITIKETFLNSIAFKLIFKYRRGAVVQISTELRPVYHVPFGRVIWSRAFYTYISPRFLQAAASQRNNLWRPSFFWKCSKFKEDFENVAKIPQKVFVFEINASQLVKLNCLY